MFFARVTMKNLIRTGLGVFGLLLACGYWMACGGDESTNTVGCVPNQTQACTGPGQCMGSQTCAADGKSWSVCDCGGGSGGSGGGTSGSGTSAGGTGTSTSAGGAGGTPVTSSGPGGTGAGGMPATTSSSSTGTGNPVGCDPMEPNSGD